MRLIRKMTDYTEELEIAINAAKEAGKAVMEVYSSSDFEIETKGDDSPVTKADLAANDVLLDKLRQTPYGIVSEETGKEDKGNNKFWIIDPLDGTKDFIGKTGEFSTMIALLVDGKSVLGVVYAPAIDTLWYAAKGMGAFVVEGNSSPKKMEVSRVKSAEDFRLVISRNHFKEKDKAIADRLGITEYKKMGSVGVKFARIGNGEAELCIYGNPYMGIWDDCASDIIIKESGGDCFDINGNTPEYDLDGLKMVNGFVGTNGQFKEEILESIRQGENE